ncbi:MAG: hypothetical protein R2725_14380 [Solirubrobacterales bacterium]
MIVALAITSLVACGGSSKPAYCSDRSSLEDSIKELPGFVTKADPNGLRTQTAAIETGARTLIESAEEDFPTETGAIGSAVRSLRATVQALPAEPTPTQLAKVGVEVATAVSAVKGFASATESKCG